MSDFIKTEDGAETLPEITGTFEFEDFDGGISPFGTVELASISFFFSFWGSADYLVGSRIAY